MFLSLKMKEEEKVFYSSLNTRALMRSCRTLLQIDNTLKMYRYCSSNTTKYYVSRTPDQTAVHGIKEAKG